MKRYNLVRPIAWLAIFVLPLLALRRKSTLAIRKLEPSWPKVFTCN
ncbi:MAG: hypothetical protein DRI81_17020 [Chloroflexi bacterium]|nr:MAG: hypothetical protein DRI81_17020 [Chloroflexota bacterium]